MFDRNAYYREYRKLNLDRVRAYEKKSDAKRERPPTVARSWPQLSPRPIYRVSLQRAFIDAELARGCVDCGTKEQVVLDLDHVRGRKLAVVSQLITHRVPELLAEIDKCEVRCANCHRRVTALRRKQA